MPKPIIGGYSTPKFSWRKLLRVALKPRNLWMFSPLKVSHYMEHTRALRAHTLCVHALDLHHYATWRHTMCCWWLLPTHTWPMSRKHVALLCIYIVGMVNGCGYGWPTKIYTICDTCRRWAVPLGLKHSEASFSPNRRIRCVYESLRYLDLELWWFCG